jgi:hypothetical protein
MRTPIAILLAALALAFPAVAATPEGGGPYNARFPQGSVGIERDLKGADRLVREGGAYTISTWVRPDAEQKGIVPLVSIGDPAKPSRFVAINDGAAMTMDGEIALTAMRSKVPAGKWTHVAAVSNGERLHLYVDGREILSAAVTASAVAPRIHLSPMTPVHFGGTLVDARIDDAAWTSEAVREIATHPPDFDRIDYLTGYRAPDAPLVLTAAGCAADGQDEVVRVVLGNPSPTPALNVGLNPVNGRGARILRLPVHVPAR